MQRPWEVMWPSIDAMYRWLTVLPATKVLSELEAYYHYVGKQLRKVIPGHFETVSMSSPAVFSRGNWLLCRIEEVGKELFRRHEAFRREHSHRGWVENLYANSMFYFALCPVDGANVGRISYASIGGLDPSSVINPKIRPLTEREWELARTMLGPLWEATLQNWLEGTGLARTSETQRLIQGLFSLCDRHRSRACVMCKGEFAPMELDSTHAVLWGGARCTECAGLSMSLIKPRLPSRKGLKTWARGGKAA